MATIATYIIVFVGLISIDSNVRAREISEQRSKHNDVEMEYKDGLLLRTQDDQFQLRVGGLLQTDARFITDNTVFIRNARINTEGYLFKYYSFQVDVDFGNGRVRLKTGFLNLGFTPLLEFRAGQFKEPFGFEKLSAIRYISFIERSLVTENLTPSRDVGVMLHGKLFSNVLSYHVGIFRGVGENPQSGDFGGKEVAARLLLSPFRQSDSVWLKGLQFGGAATYQNQNKSITGTNFKTTMDTKFLTFSPGTLHNGLRTRWGADLAWLIGPVSLRTEWIHNRMSNLEKGAARKDLDIGGWYTTVSYLLTGEQGSLIRVIPKDDFFENGWGAWELAFRVGQLSLEPSLLAGGFATGTSRATEFTVGVNWYLNSLATIRASYVKTWFGEPITVGGKFRRDEEGLLLRFQVEY